MKKEEPGGASSSDDAILLDSDDEGQQRLAAKRSRPGRMLSDDIEAHATASLSGAAAAGSNGAGRGTEQDTAWGAAGGSGGDAPVFCPVCERRWRLEDISNAQLNAHIDQCLLG